MTFTGTLDTRFSEATEPLEWGQTRDVLIAAELYWLTTVRTDGRPHVTPLVGLWSGDGFVFCTGPQEQKARNLLGNNTVAVTTGANSWSAGLDVVVEGVAVRLTAADELRTLADAYREKYNGDWDFTANDEGFGHSDGAHTAYVYRVVPDKVLAFAKAPHGQTRYRAQS